jgi:hypothetical protein
MQFKKRLKLSYLKTGLELWFSIDLAPTWSCTKERATKDQYTRSFVNASSSLLGSACDYHKKSQKTRTCYTITKLTSSPNLEDPGTRSWNRFPTIWAATLDLLSVWKKIVRYAKNKSDWKLLIAAPNPSVRSWWRWALIVLRVAIAKIAFIVVQTAIYEPWITFPVMSRVSVYFTTLFANMLFYITP